jgi:hypothetical protein
MRKVSRQPFGQRFQQADMPAYHPALTECRQPSDAGRTVSANGSACHHHGDAQPLRRAPFMRMNADQGRHFKIARNRSIVPLGLLEQGFRRARGMRRWDERWHCLHVLGLTSSTGARQASSKGIKAFACIRVGIRQASTINALKEPVMRYEQDAAQRANVLRHLSQSLAGAVAVFEKQESGPLRTFPDYKKERGRYLEIQAMIFTILDKAAEAPNRGVPQDLKGWLARMRLRAITAFTRISLAFFRNPPELLVQALGAYDILSNEYNSLKNLLTDFDMMLLEAALDDKSSLELDKVRTQMEEIVQLLQQYLKIAPPPLVIFDD